MSKRDKFVWDVVLIFSIIIIGYYGIYQMYSMHTVHKEFRKSYDEEIIGTDDILQKQIISLENNLQNRHEFDFKINKYPTDLSAVISIDKSSLGSYYTYSALRISGIVSGQTPRAIVHYRNQVFSVVKGDSIAGGIITSISNDEVEILTDGEIKEYSLQPNNQNNN